jgi:murein DD-endopeptidase MepM/ murein hydrolase activator NlpD
MSYKFYPQLGSKCHQRAQAQVPICVVTTLDHTQLLFAHVPVGSGGSTWVVQSASCSVQRFWNSSTATIKVTCEALEPNYFAPPLPLISNPEDNIIHPIGPEDNICIWMGYVDSLFTKGEDLIKLMEGDKPNLMRVFVGVVDTIGLTGTDAGFNYTFQCRDRMRYLMETAVSLSPFDLKNDHEYMNLALGGTNSVVARSEMILRLAQLGIGHVQLGKDEKEVKVINGLRINRGLIKDLGEITKAENTSIVSADFGSKVAMPPADYFYNYDDRLLAAETRTREKNLDLSPHPKFNIITSRLPFSTESVAKEYTIEQQIPIDIIKWLSNQEAYPTEVFSSHQDGDLYYVPRASDLSGLADPKRFYRTYYYRYQPPGLGEAQLLDPIAKTYPNVKIETGLAKEAQGLELDFTAPFRQLPDWAVGIINWREEFTTNAMFTNYLIANNSPNSNKDGNVTLMSMAARPPFLAGRSIAGRNKYVIDETINNRQEALAVGMQMARIHSKETRTAAMTILGDPSLIPGEIVQVVGSPLHRELGTLEALIAERFGLVDYLKREQIAYNDTLTKIKGYDKDNEKVQAVNGGDKVDSSGNQFQSLTDKPNATVGGTNIAGALGGSPVALAACTQKDRGSIIQEGIPLNTKLPTSVPVKSASSDGTATTTTAPTGIGTGGSSTTASQSGMVYPLAVGGRVTSEVGARDIGPVGSKNHGGTDIGVPTGTVVVAALAGKVTIAQKGFGKLGQAIRIEHGNNLATRYGHLHTISVAVGQEVATGQAIGTSGGGGGDPYELRGSSTGAHLHFEVRENDKIVKPSYMIFSLGNTPSKDTIANRLKVAGASAASATPTPAATTPAVPATQVPATKEEPKSAAATTDYRKQIIVTKSNKLQLVKGKSFKVLDLRLYDSNKNVVFEAEVITGTASNQNFSSKENPDLSAPLSYGDYKITTSPYFLYPKGKKRLGVISSTSSSELAADFSVGNSFFFVEKKIAQFTEALLKAPTSSFRFLDSNSTSVSASNVAKAKATGAEATGADTASTAVQTATPTTPPPTEFKVDKYEDYPDEAWKKSHFSQEPQSLFRVDAVRHDFNAVGRSLGYSVEVVLMPITG